MPTAACCTSCSARTTPPIRRTRLSCLTIRSAILSARASTRATITSASRPCWPRARTCCASTPPRATPAGRRRPSPGCASSTAIPSRSARATSSTATASCSSPRRARISSRSVSAAAPSALPARQRASAAVRLRLSSRSAPPAMNITAPPVSMCRSARTAASSMTTT